MKTTEAMHYRRYIAQRLEAEHGGGSGGAQGRLLWRTAGVSDARGFVFVLHTGEIFPSGFLPVSGGNVRQIHWWSCIAIPVCSRSCGIR